MPHRTMNLVLAAMGLAGLVVIGVLAIWGADIRRAARGGPMWKRKLVAAGLLLLTMMGVGSCVEAPGDKSGGPNATLSEAAQRKQMIAKAWRDVDTAWQFGADYAFGRHGPWPFDKAAKTAILKQTEQFDTHVATLERLGELKNIEADALRLEWDFIQEEIELFKAADLRKGWPYYNEDCRADIKRARELLGHLDALVKADTVNQQVVQMTLVRTSKLASRPIDAPERISHRLDQQARLAADKLVKAGRKLASRTATRTAALDKNKDWKIVRAILKRGIFSDALVLDDNGDPIEPGENGLFDLRAGGLDDPGEVPRLNAQALKGLENLLKQGMLCAAEVDALRWMLQIALAKEEERQKDELARHEYMMHGESESEKWARLLGELGEQKSLPRPLHAVLLSAAETRITLVSEEGGNLCMLYPYGSDLLTGIDKIKQMRKSLAIARKLPLRESGALLKDEGCKQIVRGYVTADAMAERMWTFSRLDKRCIRELFEPMGQSISSLVKQGLLGKTEAEILLAHRRFMLRIAEPEDLSFYSVIQFYACNRISRRVELLGKLALLDRPDWRVADYILPAVESDLAVLEGIERHFRQGFSRMPKRVLDKMIAIRDTAAGDLKNIRARLTVSEKSLAHTHQWQALTRVWADAQAITNWDPAKQAVASRFGGQRLTGRLRDSFWDIEALRRAGLLTDPEAGLLSENIELFIDIVGAQYTWEDSYSTCYDASVSTFDTNRQASLEKRIGLLEKLVDSPQLRPEIVAKLLYVLERDVAVPPKWTFKGRASQAQLDHAVQMQKAVGKLINQMRKRLRIVGEPLDGNVKWRGITRACSMAARAVRTGTTSQRRREIQAKLDQASSDVYLLYAQGMLTGKEMSIVDLEIHNARQRLTYSPPTDFANGIYISSVEHYCPLNVWDAVTERYDYVDYTKMLSGGLLGRPVLQIVVESLETDIGILKNRPLPLPDEDCDPAELFKKANTMKTKLAKIREKLSEGQ